MMFMENIWLVGASTMAQEYIKVLKSINCNLSVIGRGEEKALQCQNATGVKVIQGGLEKFLSSKPECCTHAIVAVDVEQLYEITMQLLQYGVKNILLEKPGSLRKEHLSEIKELAGQLNSHVVIGYNRRFYSSVDEARKIIAQDGGVVSFNFEFTEWSHEIEHLVKPAMALQNWFMANSTHVVDLAFYLCGKPIQINCFTSGRLKWHDASCVFAGAGSSINGALFSYQANWAAPGRWSVEVLTNKHRLILRPLEKLQIQDIGSININFVEIQNQKDIEFKPGLFAQVDEFIAGEHSRFCTLAEQIEMFDVYIKMANYS